MQHALALNLIEYPTSPSVTDTYSSAPTSSRTCVFHEFRVDRKTGEIYGEFITLPFLRIDEQYRAGIPRPAISLKPCPHLMDVSRSDNVVYVDFRAPAPVESAVAVDTPSKKVKRGPRPKIYLNPYAAIIKVAIAENAHWIENAVMAAMYIAVEDSKGKLNIRPGYVRRVIAMTVISTEAIANNNTFRNHDLEPVSERYVRYLAAAGRVALRNIERHLDEHPEERQRLETKIIASEGWCGEFDLDEADYVVDPYGTAA